jgi:DNA phosphorothioation-dependent restriction protein DptH
MDHEQLLLHSFEAELGRVMKDMLLERESSTRIRFDGFVFEEALRILPNVQGAFDAENGIVAVLKNGVVADGVVNVDQAIELRNRPHFSLGLIVTLGEESGESSLHNTFESFQYADLIERVCRELESNLDSGGFDEEFVSYLRDLKPFTVSDVSWAQFLLAVTNVGSIASIGENLWRIGLIPDLGANPASRLRKNSIFVKRLSAPPGPSSSTVIRLDRLGLQNAKLRWDLKALLGNLDMTSPVSWCKAILDSGRNWLTFESWVSEDDSAAELTNLTVSSFVDAKGNPKRYSRLTRQDGSLVFSAELVPDDSGTLSGKVGIEWATVPAQVSTVSSWLVEVVPPKFVRELEGDSVAIGSINVPGAKRKTVIPIGLSKDDFTAGSRFVVRISALDSSGQIVTLSSQENPVQGSIACVDEGEEFQVGDQSGEVNSMSITTREASTPAFPLARVEEVKHRGSSWELADEIISFDDQERLIDLLLPNGRKYSIEFSPTLISAQQSACADSGSAGYFTAKASMDEHVTFDDLQRTALPEIPRAFMTARRKFLKDLGSKCMAGRAGIEFATWDEGLIKNALSYGAAYRRALEVCENDEQLEALLKIDRICLEVQTSNLASFEAVILLPLHPLRAMWWAQFVSTCERAATRLRAMSSADRFSVPKRFMSDVSPENYPFIQISESDTLLAYMGEVTFGSSVYVDPAISQSVDSLAAARRVLGITGHEKLQQRVVSSVVTRLRDFERLHPDRNGLALSFVGDDEAQFASQVMETLLEPQFAAAEIEAPKLIPYRLDVFNSGQGYVRPAPNLSELQRRYSSLNFQGSYSYLVPPLSVTVRTVDELRTTKLSADLVVLKNYEEVSISSVETPSNGISYLDGLTTRLNNSRTSSDAAVSVSPTISGPRGSDPGGLVSAHGTQLAMVQKFIGRDSGTPGLKIVVPEESIETLRYLHERAEWVVSLEKRVGVHLFDDVLRTQGANTFILDYAVDGVDVNSDRITVTSADREEVQRIVSGAMNQLRPVSDVGDSAQVLQTLSHLSDRLALKLLEQGNQTKEVVGLACVVTHLRLGRKLENTLLIPVDAHPELFHPTQRGRGWSGRRCDLLMIRIKPSGQLEVELVEVKFRSETDAKSQALFDDVTNQLIVTREFIKKHLLPTDGSRADDDWQWSRFCNLLHFYAEKSRSSGYLDAGEEEVFHESIDKAYTKRDSPLYSASGYIVSIDSLETMPDKSHNGVVVKFLGANRLNVMGQTTMSFGPPA